MRTPFEEIFSEKSIIEVLCKIRIRRSKARHDALFFRRVSDLAVAPREPDEFEALFPSRKTWHRFRPSKRVAVASDDLTLEALRRAVNRGLLAATAPSWVPGLKALAQKIRESALAPEGHRFAVPRIIPKQKSPGSDEYRPVATFVDIEDKVADSLIAKYLRETLDAAFEPCSVAFRPPRRGAPPLDRDQAMAGITGYRAARLGQELAVAECDIRGFFDCVSHEIARKSLDRVIELLKVRTPGVTVDARSLRAFENYLSCYTFPSVVIVDEPELKRRENNPKAYYKWPAKGENSLEQFYGPEATKQRIGVPQGGALSCLISNLLLDLADKEVVLAAQRTGVPVLYFRYCDDMVIVAETLEACRTCFRAYTDALSHLRLPYHAPEEWLFYGPDFFEKSKTKAPYVWHGRKWFRHSPWIQFLGYQVRYDGLLRVRKKSLSKHREKMDELFDDLRRGVHEERSRVNRNRLLYRMHQKLIAISVGRVVLPEKSAPAGAHPGPLPKCWASGFRTLHKQPFVEHPLRSFDRYRTHLKRKLGRYTRGLELPDKTVAREYRENSTRLGFAGAPFSYSRQFANTDGPARIFAPYQPDSVDRQVLLPCYHCRQRLQQKSSQRRSAAS